MKFNEMSPFLRLPMILWAPEDEGAGGGNENDVSTGNDDAETGEGDGTALGGGEPGGKPDEANDESGGASDDASEGDGKGEEGEDEDGDDDGADEVPEDGVYDFGELPEGIELDDTKRDEWSGTFKELGITRKQAEGLIAAQIKDRQDAAKEFSDFIADKQKKDEKAAKADKDIGGEKWGESTKLANTALKFLSGQAGEAGGEGSEPKRGAIHNLILTSGNGNNPEVIRELRRLGQLLGEDRFEGGSQHETPVAKESSWYGNTTPETKKG